MDNYKFTVITRDGEKISGVIEGANEMDAASRLKESYPIVVNIAPVQEDSKTAKFLKSDINGNKLNNKAFTLMCIQFANNFYVRSKGKDIAVRLVCGATFNKVTAYLLVQTLQRGFA